MADAPASRAGSRKGVPVRVRGGVLKIVISHTCPRSSTDQNNSLRTSYLFRSKILILMKQCSRCDVKKPVECFRKNVSRKDGLQSACTECHNKYTRSHYNKNKTYYIEKAARNTEKYKQVIRDLKEANPCMDCGNSYPYYCMDFDHLRDKEFNVATLMSNGRLKEALEEIKKCDLVCAICHRKRTFARMA